MAWQFIPSSGTSSGQFVLSLHLSEQVMQSPEAVSILELTMSSLDESESDED